MDGRGSRQPPSHVELVERPRAGEWQFPSQRFDDLYLGRVILNLGRVILNLGRVILKLGTYQGLRRTFPDNFWYKNLCRILRIFSLGRVIFSLGRVIFSLGRGGVCFYWRNNMTVECISDDDDDSKMESLQRQFHSKPLSHTSLVVVHRQDSFDIH
jgi:hypothetical protein